MPATAPMSAAAKPPKPVPKSVLILRRRVLEELRKPRRHAHPAFESDAALGRFVGLRPSSVSHWLRSRHPHNIRGVSWQVVDRLALLFDLEIWELFYIDRGDPTPE